MILCADAVAGWHSAWLASFGQRFDRDEDAWRALDEPHFIYFAGITLRPDAPAAAVAAAPGTVCDSWSCLDLAPFGFRAGGSEAWFYREPGPLPAEDMPPELELMHVSTPEEVAEFEAVSVRGFDERGGDRRAVLGPSARDPRRPADGDVAGPRRRQGGRCRDGLPHRQRGRRLRRHDCRVSSSSGLRDGSSRARRFSPTQGCPRCSHRARWPSACTNVLATDAWASCASGSGQARTGDAPVAARRLDEHLPVVERKKHRAVGLHPPRVAQHGVDICARRVVCV